MIVESLIPIDENELLLKVKDGLNLKGNDYQDDAVRVWIDTVKQDLEFFGVSKEVVGSALAIGCIARGVDDHWLSQRGEYSEMFYTQAERLRCTKVGGEVNGTV